MGTIHILPDLLASQVAAGEVVERPASVLKELIENSVDAGAKRIIVEFQHGGTRMIRVIDDGCGMDRSDALLCLERHATSKIRENRDLSAIKTMGFRGEALPSIASVSRFRLATRRREDEVGTLIEVEGGKIQNVKDSVETLGTKIEVSDLFFNVPARKKFLRSEQSEGANLLYQIQFLAIANPRIAFICRREEREVFRLAGTDDLAVRIREIYGEAFLKKLLPVSLFEKNGVSVYGWIGVPGEGRSNRNFQMFFVNGRMVRSSILSIPFREAYSGLLSHGLHPPAVLFFVMDPSTVDCNVHPSKREVRFHHPNILRSLVQEVTRKALGRESCEISVASFSDPLFPPIASSWKPGNLSTQYRLSDFDLHASESARVAENPIKDSAGTLTPYFLGQLGKRYLLFDAQGSLMIVQIRAAKERIFYEHFLGRLAEGELESQNLLLPEVLEMAPADLAWIDAHHEWLRQSGLIAESFGKTSLKIDAIPAHVSSIPTREIVIRLMDDLRTIPDASIFEPSCLREALAASVSRLAASSANLAPGEEAAEMLMRDLLSCDLPYITPKGRPTMSQLSEEDIRRRFSF